MDEEPNIVHGKADGASDEELAIAAREGSLDAFSELVRRYQSRLCAFLLQKTGNRQDAEDLAQETFLAAYRHLSRYQSRNRFGSWLFTIAHRRATSHFRGIFRRRRFYEEFGGQANNEEPDPAAIAQCSDDSRSLWGMSRSTLNETQHTALWLFYAEEMSVAEIAFVLGKSPGGVKVTLHRARLALSDRLASENAEAGNQVTKCGGAQRRAATLISPDAGRRPSAQPETPI